MSQENFKDLKHANKDMMGFRSPQFKPRIEYNNLITDGKFPINNS